MTGSFSNKILINDILIYVKTESNACTHTTQHNLDTTEFMKFVKILLLAGNITGG
jgi:hypothetical protein